MLCLFRVYFSCYSIKKCSKTFVFYPMVLLWRERKREFEIITFICDFLVLWLFLFYSKRVLWDAILSK